MWEKLCWNAGREWIIADKMWTRMWEGKKKPFKMETGDRGSVTVYPGKMVKDSRSRGFAILNILSPKTKEKEGRDFDVEIYCIAIQKADKDDVIANVVNQVKDQCQGKRLWMREPKRSIIRRLQQHGFEAKKDSALGSWSLTLDIPKGKKRKRTPAPVYLDPDEILSF